ncbi:unnamed protein product [Cercopithifilaria johnstoni]|uniref:Uncharacterized protein n=1 Tax=Cercopithifilaria johnstoni TaxID=2874296 RepID=A0A8J2Q9B6_9BILA|nr:unnamed protein product [Cercopithifilaria johnstoni]
MGCCSSNIFHDEEKGLEDHLFPYLDYQGQPDDEYKQLDTENDQKGDTAVEHIFKKTKMVYGQPPKDMRNFQIDWKHDYNIDFVNRPCPYDFPAFEGDKPADYDENKDVTVEKEKLKKDNGEENEKGGGRKRKSKSKGKGRKKSDGKNDKKGRKSKRSANELDQCSLSAKS